MCDKRDSSSREITHNTASDGRPAHTPNTMQLQMPPLGNGRVRRSQFAVVLVLVPINGTFEKKSLVIPFAPEVLKLGRQTTQRSIASANNGYFDSRVLSRQHAELWADRDTGKVWIKDCKSSNGTYVNRQRLSGENTESDPCELKRGDLLDLGIDIASDDNSSLVYHKIAARVERVAMIPLQAAERASNTTAAGSAPTISTPQSPSVPPSPTESAPSTPSTIKAPKRDDLRSAIFGSPLESLALNHLQSSVGNSLVHDNVRTQVDFELAAKRLVGLIRAVRVDTAKIQSVQAMLDDMQRVAAAAKSDEPEVNVAALRAEVDRLRTENAELSALVHDLKTNGSLAVQVTGGPRRRVKQSSQLWTPKIDNTVVLVATTVLMTVAGMSIMFFFNPPA